MSELSQLHVLDEDAWRERTGGWLIVGGSLRRGPVVSLAMRKDIPDEELSGLWDSQVPTRVFYFNLLTGVSGYDQFETGMPFPKIGSSEVPDSLTLCAARGPIGPVWVANRSYAEMEAVRPDAMDRPRNTVGMRRLARIQGKVYLVSAFRRLFRRDGPNQWTVVSEGIPALTDKDLSGKRDFGFSDLHGLSEDNMYAVGGHGDVWRYDGTRWIQCDFPSNKQLDTVTVAPDGQVYISGQSGSLWVGREDTWTLLHSGGSSVPYNDSCWFNDRLWLISDYQFHIWEEGELRRPIHNGVKLVHAGYMDCLDGLMLIAGNNGTVHISDGTDWKTVIRPFPG